MPEGKQTPQETSQEEKQQETPPNPTHREIGSSPEMEIDKKYANNPKPTGKKKRIHPERYGYRNSQNPSGYRNPSQ